MRRVTQAQAEVVEHALAVVGPRLARRLRHVDFLCGVDPAYVGLHSARSVGDGRSYGDTAHCAYSWHTSDRSTTVVLPTLEPVDVVVHELGHALHQRYAFDHVAVPVTDYARRSHQEAFAEHFTSRFFWYGDQAVWWSDEATRSLIDDLETTEGY